MPTNIADFVYFRLVYDYLSKRINTFGMDLMASFMTWASALALLMVTLWIVIQGYRLITGQSRESLMAMVMNMTRIVIIVSAATTMSVFGSNLQQLFTTDLSTAVNQLFTGSDDTAAQTIDQNLASIRANADGLIRFLSNQELFPACSPSDPRCDPASALKNLELSVSFNISDAGARTLTGVSPSSGSQVDFSALLTKHQFSSATARYALLNNRDPRSKAYRDKWINWFKTNQSVLQAAGKELLTNIAAATLLIQQTGEDGKPTRETGNPDQYTLWAKETRDKLDAAPKTEAAWKTVLQQQLDALLAKMRALDPDFDRKLADMGKAYVRYLALRRDLESTLITDPGLTLEYTFSQPTLQPKLHTVKIAYAFSPKGAPGTVNSGTITFNAALDFFQNPQLTGTRQDTSRWKDAQAALQFDRPLGPADSPAQLSVGAYYQYQIHPGIFTIPADASMLPGTSIPLPPGGSPILAQKGSIFVAQATMTVRIASSGLKVPMGISWSNRTDLVKGNEVRGHVGFTFDSTPLFLLPGLK